MLTRHSTSQTPSDCKLRRGVTAHAGGPRDHAHRCTRTSPMSACTSMRARLQQARECSFNVCRCAHGDSETMVGTCGILLARCRAAALTAGRCPESCQKRLLYDTPMATLRHACSDTEPLDLRKPCRGRDQVHKMSQSAFAAGRDCSWKRKWGCFWKCRLGFTFGDAPHIH